MVPPLLIEQSTPIREAITNLFMYNLRAIFVVDEQKMLIGTLNQKDLLRGSLTTSNDQTPVAVCMTRLANVVTVTPEMNILEVAQLMIQHDTEALAVVDQKNSRKIIGKITKSRILAYIVEQAKATELNR